MTAEHIGHIIESAKNNPMVKKIRLRHGVCYSDIITGGNVHVVWSGHSEVIEVHLEKQSIYFNAADINSITVVYK